MGISDWRWISQRQVKMPTIYCEEPGPKTFQSYLVATGRFTRFPQENYQ